MGGICNNWGFLAKVGKYWHWGPMGEGIICDTRAPTLFILHCARWKYQCYATLHYCIPNGCHYNIEHGIYKFIEQISKMALIKSLLHCETTSSMISLPSSRTTHSYPPSYSPSYPYYYYYYCNCCCHFCNYYYYGLCFWKMAFATYKISFVVAVVEVVVVDNGSIVVAAGIVAVVDLWLLVWRIVVLSLLLVTSMKKVVVVAALVGVAACPLPTPVVLSFWRSAHCPRTPLTKKYIKVLGFSLQFIIRNYLFFYLLTLIFYLQKQKTKNNNLPKSLDA